MVERALRRHRGIRGLKAAKCALLGCVLLRGRTDEQASQCLNTIRPRYCSFGAVLSTHLIPSTVLQLTLFSKHSPVMLLRPSQPVQLAGMVELSLFELKSSVERDSKHPGSPQVLGKLPCRSGMDTDQMRSHPCHGHSRLIRGSCQVIGWCCVHGHCPPSSKHGLSRAVGVIADGSWWS